MKTPRSYLPPSLLSTIKWLLVLALCGAIWRRLATADFSSFLVQLEQGWSVRRFWLLAATALMPLNWWLEAAKWRHLMILNGQLPGQPQAFRAVMTGLALALFTPARIGDYLGRSLQAGPFGKWRAARATLLSHLAQWIPMLSTGIPAWLWLKAPAKSAQLLAPGSFLLLALSGTILYLSLEHLSKILHNDHRKNDRFPFRLFRLPLTEENQATFPPQKHLAKALGMGALRYGVYSLQLYFLLVFFGLPLTWSEGLAGVWLVFLLQSGLPLPFVGSVLLRTELAFWVWAEPDATAVLAAMTGLFVLNLALPALLGAGFLVQIKDHQNESNENKTSLSDP